MASPGKVFQQLFLDLLDSLSDNISWTDNIFSETRFSGSGLTSFRRGVSMWLNRCRSCIEGRITVAAAHKQFLAVPSTIPKARKVVKSSLSSCFDQLTSLLFSCPSRSIPTYLTDWVSESSKKKVAVLLDFVQMRGGGEGPAQIFRQLFTNCI